MTKGRFFGLLLCAGRQDYVSAACFGLVCVLFTLQPAWPQSTPSAFDSRALENATTISGGVCSNPVIGISYQLPQGLQPEDAAAIRQAAVAGARASQGIGPEAQYFLYGYQESTTVALLCGAAGQSGSVQMVASPASLIMSQGQNALDKLVTSLGQELHAQSSPTTVRIVGGLKLECADVQTEATSAGKAKIDVRATSCAAVLDHYVVIWNLIGYSEAEWKRFVAGLDSVKVSAPQPLKALPSASPSSSNSSQRPIAQDFQAEIDAFMKAWLADRDAAKTMAFFDAAAYSAPPLIGTYCDGWYRAGTPPEQVAGLMSESLKGVPEQFPKQTAAPTIFKAWNRLPSQWVSLAANDVAKDHFLIARLDSDSLPRIFGGIFATSDYRKFLESQIQKSGNAYWVIFPELMPDGDLFVIFTLWQRTGNQWKIKDMDIICQ